MPEIYINPNGGEEIETILNNLPDADLNLSSVQQAALDALGDDSAETIDISSISSNLITLTATNGGVASDVVRIEVSTANLTDISSIAALEAALDDQTATGALNSLTIFDANDEAVVTVGFEDDLITIAVGPAVFTVGLGTPATFEGIFALADALTQATDTTTYNSLTNAERDAVNATLGAANLTGLGVVFDGESLFDLTLGATQAGITVSDLDFTLTGTDLPLATLLQLINFGRDSEMFNDVQTLEALGLTGLTITGTDDEVLVDFQILADDDLDALVDIDLQVGDDENSSFFGTAGDDYINPGANFYDAATGNFGFDFINGSLGNDTIDYRNNGPEGYQGLQYADPGLGFTINVSLDTATNSMLVMKSLGGSDVVEGVNAVIGTNSFNGGFGMFGTNGADTFDLNLTLEGGWTSLDGNAGNDTITANVDEGRLRLNYLNNFMDNGVNVNLATGVVSNDGYGDQDTLVITGTNGEIELRTGNVDDQVVGGSALLERYILQAGNDTLDAGGGYDILRYDRSGVDAIITDLSTGVISGTWGGTAFTHTISGVEEIRGSRVSDDITGSAAADVLRGHTGDDTLLGDAGDDTLSGEEGNDSVQGGEGNDLIEGGEGNDYLEGGASFDTINAGEGNDTVAGDNGRDLVFLNQGNDLYLDNAQGGELGRDTVFAGLGDDTVEGGNGDDVFFGEAGNDVINARLGNDTVYGGDQFDTISAGEGNDEVHGGNGRDLIYLNQGNDIFFDNGQGGELGSDTVFTGIGDDTVQGGNGGDVFYGEDGNDLINARLGDDTVFGGNNFDTISAGEGNDEVHGGNGRDLIFLNQGDDIYFDNGQGGELGRDTVFAGIGNDTVQGGNGDDAFYGEDGNDLILGRLGNDQIFGGAGMDTMDAGAGADTITGGDGADTFIFAAFEAASGTDLVTDFTLGVDVINLTGTMAGSVTVGYDGGTNTATVSLLGTDVVVLEGVGDISGFGVDDILFT